MSSTKNVKPFSKKPQVPKEMERLLTLTLEELARGEVAGLTIVVSRPESHESRGGVTIRKAWEDRLQHVAGLSIALHDASDYSVG